MGVALGSAFYDLGSNLNTREVRLRMHAHCFWRLSEHVSRLPKQTQNLSQRELHQTNSACGNLMRQSETSTQAQEVSKI